MKKLLILAAAVVTLSLTAVAATGAAADGEDGPFGNFLTRVADKLGISEEQLETAIQDARLETIDEALAEGRITEEQAAKMRERVQEGASLFPKRPHHRPGAGVIVGSAAQVLDMEKAGLVEQLKDGSSLAEVAEAQGMSVEVFTAALLSQTEAQIDEMVDTVSFLLWQVGREEPHRGREAVHCHAPRALELLRLSRGNPMRSRSTGHGGVAGGRQ